MSDLSARPHSPWDARSLEKDGDRLGAEVGERVSVAGDTFLLVELFAVVTGDDEDGIAIEPPAAENAHEPLHRSIDRGQSRVVSRADLCHVLLVGSLVRLYRRYVVEVATAIVSRAHEIVGIGGDVRKVCGAEEYEPGEWASVRRIDLAKDTVRYPLRVRERGYVSPVGQKAPHEPDPQQRQAPGVAGQCRRLSEGVDGEMGRVETLEAPVESREDVSREIGDGEGEVIAVAQFGEERRSHVLPTGESGKHVTDVVRPRLGSRQRRYPGRIGSSDGSDRVAIERPLRDPVGGKRHHRVVLDAIGAEGVRREYQEIRCRPVRGPRGMAPRAEGEDCYREDHGNDHGLPEGEAPDSADRPPGESESGDSRGTDKQRQERPVEPGGTDPVGHDVLEERERAAAEPPPIGEQLWIPPDHGEKSETEQAETETSGSEKLGDRGSLLPARGVPGEREQEPRDRSQRQMKKEETKLQREERGLGHGENLRRRPGVGDTGERMARETREVGEPEGE